MKKHRKLEARKRVSESLNQLNEVKTDLERKALRRHLDVLGKEFFTYNQISKQKRKIKT